MGNRLTLPLLLLAALLAGGAFFWMSGGERSGEARRTEGSSSPAAVEIGAAALETPAALPAGTQPEAARAPSESADEPGAKPATKRAAGGTTAVTGQVVDRFGAPVAKARVLAAADTGFALDFELEEELPWLKRLQTETDSDGRFRLEGIQPGALQLGVRAGGFAPHDQRGIPVPATGVDLGAVTLARGAILTGIVVDPDGRAVAGARIVRRKLDEGGLFLFGTRRPVAATGADGRFRIDELACGAWSFLVQSEDHPDLGVEGLAEEPGVEVSGLRWQLEPGATLGGTVTGIPSAERGQLEVRATRGSSSADHFSVFGSGRTAAVDANGAFLLRGLAPGETYTLEARRARSENEFGFWQRSRSNSVQARAGDSGVILAYQPEAAITLTVHDAATRAPIERMEVEAGIDWPAQVSDDDGNPRRLFPGGSVRVGGLRPSSDSERVQLRVKATGYREYERSDIAVRPGQELDLGAIYLDPVPVVRVHVTDARSGKPIEGALVRLQKEEEEGRLEVRRSLSISEDEGHEALEFGEGRSARTDSEGWAELTSFEDATVSISARAEGYAPARLARVPLARGERVEHELRLSQGGAVHVQVLDAHGVPLAAARVQHRANDEGPEGGTIVLGAPRGGEVTDAEGRVLFANLAPGLHSFKLAPKGGDGGMFASMDRVVVAGMGADDDGQWSQVQVVEGETSEVVLRAAPSSSLAGRVREAGKILPGATLRLEKAGEESGGPRLRLPGMSSGPEGRSDGEGRYEIADVEAASYKLVVEHPTRRMPAEYPLELREGDNTFDVDLALAIVSGRILDQEGKGIAGVRVWPERRDPEQGGRSARFVMVMADDSGGSVMDSGQFGERALTDAEGRYSLRGVASDADLVIRAEADSVQPGRSEVMRLAPNEVKEGVDVHLEPAGSIKVEAKLRDGAPARFQLVQAEYLDEADPRPEPKFGFLQQGSTQLSGLKPGRWKVNVRSAQGGPGQSDPGQDQEIVVRPQEQATATFEVE